MTFISQCFFNSLGVCNVKPTRKYIILHNCLRPIQMSKYLNKALGVIQSEHINSMQVATIMEDNIVIYIKDQTYNTLYSILKSKVHPRCASLYNCLVLALGKWWNTEVWFWKIYFLYLVFSSLSTELLAVVNMAARVQCPCLFWYLMNFKLNPLGLPLVPFRLQ